MIMEWNKAQKQAIENRGNNLLVAAAAGSGKTTVLIERIKRLILEDRIVGLKNYILGFSFVSVAGIACYEINEILIFLRKFIGKQFVNSLRFEQCALRLVAYSEIWLHICQIKISPYNIEGEAVKCGYAGATHKVKLSFEVHYILSAAGLVYCLSQRRHYFFFHFRGIAVGSHFAGAAGRSLEDANFHTFSFYPIYDTSMFYLVHL